MLFSGKTDVGKRRANNQDCFSIVELSGGAYLFTVCDGMGGANGGNIASEIACGVYTEKVKENFSIDTDENIIRSAITSANTAVYEVASTSDELKGMGTTLVSVLIRADGQITAANVGDSRLYGITKDGIKQITRDHSYVQYLVDMGQITLNEAKKASIRNIIIRSIGNEAQTTPDFFTLNISEYEYLLLCSDGLSNCVSNELILKTVNELGCNTEECAEELIKLANEGGGNDNITALVIKL